MSTSYRIKVLGRELLVKSKASAETVKEIETFVNGKVSEVATKVKGGDPQIVAILALMNIAEAYLSLVKEKDSVGVQAEKVNRLLQRLDSVVEES